MSRARKFFGALTGTVGDNVRRIGNRDFAELIKAAATALPGTATVSLPFLIKSREGHDASLLTVAMDNARRAPHDIALEMGDEVGGVGGARSADFARGTRAGVGWRGARRCGGAGGKERARATS